MWWAYTPGGLYSGGGAYIRRFTVCLYINETLLDSASQ
jgi:hypothetical protein